MKTCDSCVWYYPSECRRYPGIILPGFPVKAGYLPVPFDRPACGEYEAAQTEVDEAHVDEDEMVEGVVDEHEDCGTRDDAEADDDSTFNEAEVEQDT